MLKTKSKVNDYLVWTESKLQLLETKNDFKGKRAYYGVNWECATEKYVQILNIFVSILPLKASAEYFQHSGSFFT